MSLRDQKGGGPSEGEGVFGVDPSDGVDAEHGNLKQLAGSLRGFQDAEDDLRPRSRDWRWCGCCAKVGLGRSLLRVASAATPSSSSALSASDRAR